MYIKTCKWSCGSVWKVVSVQSKRVANAQRLDKEMKIKMHEARSPSSSAAWVKSSALVQECHGATNIWILNIATTRTCGMTLPSPTPVWIFFFFLESTLDDIFYLNSIMRLQVKPPGRRRRSGTWFSLGSGPGLWLVFADVGVDHRLHLL